MAVEKAYRTDAEAILSHRWDNGGDLWATPDKRLLKGAPFSALESPLYLLELGMEPGDPLMHQVAALFFSVWQEDGRFKMYPQGGIYPCQTIHAADLLCHLGYAGDARLQRTWRHLLDTQCADGGWRCLKFSFGRGPETAYSNPYPTLVALDALPLYGQAQPGAGAGQGGGVPAGALADKTAHRSLPLRHRHPVHASRVPLPEL